MYYLIISTWRDRSAGAIGSAGANAALAALLMASLARPALIIRDPMPPDPGPPPSPVTSFEVTPSPAGPLRADVLTYDAPECRGSGTLARAPAIAAAARLEELPAMAHPPRLCARVAADGHVLAARVLRSSGRTATDRLLERRALLVRFQPASRAGAPVAASVTLDVYGSVTERPAGRAMPEPWLGPL